MDETAQGGAPAPAEPKEPADGMARGPQAAADEAPRQSAGSAAPADATSLSSVIGTARAASDDLVAVFDVPDESEAGAPVSDPVADGATERAANAPPEPWRVEDLPEPAVRDRPEGEALADPGATTADAADDLAADIALAAAESSAEPSSSDAPAAEASVPHAEDVPDLGEQPTAAVPKVSPPEPSASEPGSDLAEPALAEARAEAAAPPVLEERVEGLPSERELPDPGATAAVAPGDTTPAEPGTGPAEDEAAEPAQPEEHIPASPSELELPDPGATAVVAPGDTTPAEPGTGPAEDEAAETARPEEHIPAPPSELELPDPGVAAAVAPGDTTPAEPGTGPAEDEAAEPAQPKEHISAALSALELPDPDVTAAVAMGDTTPVEAAPGPTEDEAEAAAHPIVEAMEAHDRFQEDLEAPPAGMAAAPAAGPPAGSDEPAPAQVEARVNAPSADSPEAEPTLVPAAGRPAEAAIVATEASAGAPLDGRAADTHRADRQDAASGAGETPAVRDADDVASEPAAQPEPGAEFSPAAAGAAASGELAPPPGRETPEQAWSATPAVPLGPAPAPVAVAGAAARAGPEAFRAGPRPASPAWRTLPPEDLVRVARPWLWRALRGAAMAAAGLAATVLVLIVAYRWVDPPVSTLMLGQSLAGTPIERTWVPIERVSPNLIRAVVLSEDAAFCRHRGVDWRAIEEAMEDSRGGSTITMQVVKNLFLWPSRSYVRKAIEIGLAYLVEAVWSKRRIMEIYLNIAEWGDGIFGAEAASRAHFDKRAARLTAQEAALLAVSLPNPIERTPAAPSLGTGRLASRLMLRMAAAQPDLSCLPVPRRPARSAPKKAPLVPGP